MKRILGLHCVIIDEDTDVEVNFHVIESIYANYPLNVIQATVASYVNKNAYLKGKNMVGNPVSIQFDNVDLTNITDILKYICENCKDAVYPGSDDKTFVETAEIVWIEEQEAAPLEAAH